MSKLSNALTLLNILSARSVVSLDEIASHLEISHRGVQRLRDELELVGYEIETVMGPGGGYALKKQVQIQPIAFSLQERKVLKQALSVLVQSKNPSFGKDFVATVSKLSNQLEYHDVSTALAFQSIRLNVDIEKYQHHLEIFDQAIGAHQRLKLVYQKNHQTQNTYTFEPYELVLVNEFWYLLGYDERGRYLSLKVNRMANVELLDETFRFDEDTKLGGNLTEFGYKIKPMKVSLEISNLDYLAEYIWGKGQVITWLDDHRFCLEVEFPNELAVKDFILKGGANIYIRYPVSLQQWVVKQAQKTQARYL